MKRFLPLLSLAFSFFSCAPETETTEASADSAGEDTVAIVDTFSVKRPAALTPEEKKQLATDKQKVNDIANDAATIITGDESSTVQKEFSAAVVTNPDVPASFPGGHAAMTAFINKKCIYPPVAYQNEIKGTVLLKAIIEPDGKIGGITVQRGLGYGCDEDAVDCVRSMPNWIAAKKNNVTVRTAVVIPIVFNFME